VIILGGYDKHADFNPLCKEIAASSQIDSVVLMGQTAKQLQNTLEEAGFTRIVRAYSMEDAIHMSRELAVAGGNVLLSPACASFDMFQDYEHRGEVFKKLVNQLR